ncbi:MAG TPA: AtpZ/AtpI family protein [Rhodospirillales bacterium]|nr:AtpZ/AtpI family protein [Rhodospirillales bacterium]
MSDDHPNKDLKDLDNRLKQARQEGKIGAPENRPGGTGDASGFSMAMRVGSELVSALIVGVVIGLLLDNWLDTGPWFFVLFFFLGAAAGVLNVYRAASSMGSAPGYIRPEDKIDG